MKNICVCLLLGNALTLSSMQPEKGRFADLNYSHELKAQKSSIPRVHSLEMMLHRARNIEYYLRIAENLIEFSPRHYILFSALYRTHLQYLQDISIHRKLITAIYQNDHHRVKKFLKRSKIDINLTTEGFTLLHCSALGGSLKIAKLLMNAGADPTFVNNGGFTPVQLALLRGHDNYVRLFPQLEKAAAAKRREIEKQKSCTISVSTPSSSSQSASSSSASVVSARAVQQAPVSSRQSGQTIAAPSSSIAKNINLHPISGTHANTYSLCGQCSPSVNRRKLFFTKHIVS